MFVICYLFVVYALICYIKQKKGDCLFWLFASSTGLGFIDTSTAPVKTSDFLIVATIIILGSEYAKNPKFFRLKGDGIGRALIIFISFTILVMIGTIVVGSDTPNFAFRCGRWSITYLLYFYVRTFTFKDLNRFLDLMLVGCVISGIAFYLQPLGIDLLQGRVDEAMSRDEQTRYANTPEFANLFFMQYLVKQNISKGKKVFMLCFFGFMFVLSMWRGAIIMIAVMSAVYLLYNGSKKSIIYLAVSAGVYFAVIAPMFEYRDNQSGGEMSTFEEIKLVLSRPADILNIYETEGGGNYMFRVAMFAERIIYILNNPKYIPFGVGTIHEDSPNQKHIFALGTQNENNQYGKEMLHSVDVELVTIICLYGFIGLVLYILFFYKWVKCSLPLLKCSKEPVVIMSALASIGFTISMFNGAFFTTGSGISQIFIVSVTSFAFKEYKGSLAMVK